MGKGINIKPTRKSLSRFAYFKECQDQTRLPQIPFDKKGYSAAECFHAHETFGYSLPCREPIEFSRALNGKEQHGITVTNCAEDYVGRILFACELKANYPEWVRKDILGRSRQIAMRDIGYIPTFVLTGEDFTTLELPNTKVETPWYINLWNKLKKVIRRTFFKK